MKVIKEVPWEHPFTCTGCKSELIAEASDVRYTNFEDGNYHYAECPSCGTRHEFKHAHSTLPPKVLNGSYNRRKS